MDLYSRYDSPIIYILVGDRYHFYDCGRWRISDYSDPSIWKKHTIPVPVLPGEVFWDDVIRKKRKALGVNWESGVDHQRFIIFLDNNIDGVESISSDNFDTTRFYRLC